MAADDEPADELLAARARRSPGCSRAIGSRCVGLLRANGVTFTAPLSGATCIWYFTQAQTWDKTRWSQQAVTERRTPDVLLADETGSALIRMRAAVFRLEDLKHDWSYEPPPPWDGRSTATTANVKAFMAAHGRGDSLSASGAHRSLAVPGVIPTRAVRYHERCCATATASRWSARPARLWTPARGPEFRQLPLRTVFGDASPIIVSDEPGVCS